jgi:hypothetical protein
MGVFIGGVRSCSGWRLGAWGPLVRSASHELGWAATFSCSTAFPTLDTPLTDLLWHVVKTVFGNALGPGRPTKGVGPVGPTLGLLGLSLVPRRPFMSYHPWTPLVLDIIKMCMNFGPYGAFPSSDVPEMVDQQNSWNSLVISTYLLYLEWNIGMHFMTTNNGPRQKHVLWSNTRYMGAWLSWFQDSYFSL